MENALRRRSGDVEIDTLVHQHEQQVRDRLHELLQTSENSVQESQCHVHHGQAARVVRSVADRLEADLLVMGTVCRTGAAGFLIGNTAETILADVTCSILALKPEGFISPIEMATETNPLTEKFAS
jgi:nucleotide-binding universal stress UspA family protein